ncbi:Probable aspartic proteinase GIP2 [Linum perenne]
MASSSSSSPPILPLYFLIISTLLLSTSAQPSFRPKSLILPTTKDPATLQYTTRLLQRTPRVPLTLLLHLGGENLWVDCSSPNYISSTYTPARCRSSLCSLAGSNGCGDCFSPPSPGCNNNTCGVSPENPITRTSTSAATAAGESAGEYYIGVNGINVDGKAGGTRLSTVDPYTVMEASIYSAVTAAFVEAAAARNITRRARAVAPFEICYETKGITPTRLGYAVPTVDLVMLNRGSSISLSLFGANTMVQVSDDVACLGFVNGGSGARSAIVVGGYQMENNLVEFDLAGSRIGFSGSLLGRRTTCGNFNFTSAA